MAGQSPDPQQQQLLQIMQTMARAMCLQAQGRASGGEDWGLEGDASMGRLPGCRGALALEVDRRNLETNPEGITATNRQNRGVALQGTLAEEGGARLAAAVLRTGDGLLRLSRCLPAGVWPLRGLQSDGSRPVEVSGGSSRTPPSGHGVEFEAGLEVECRVAPHPPPGAALGGSEQGATAQPCLVNEGLGLRRLGCSDCPAPSRCGNLGGA